MNDERRWEEALIDYSYNASIGRLFSGLIHNLNGVGQAFSMQTELLSMMLVQANSCLERIENADSMDVAHENAVVLREMLAKRSGLTEHLTKEVRMLYDVMRRCTAVMAGCRDSGGIHAFKLKHVIASEVEFLAADSFFKHKVSKKLELADNIPALLYHQTEFHNILSALIENASQSLERGTFPEGDQAKMTITSSFDKEMIRVDVLDNGLGVDAAVVKTLFEPFVSGNQRLGLGLYLAEKIAKGLKGLIRFDSRPGRTCFSLRIPISEVAGEKDAASK